MSVTDKDLFTSSTKKIDYNDLIKRIKNKISQMQLPADQKKMLTDYATSLNRYFTFNCEHCMDLKTIALVPEVLNYECGTAKNAIGGAATEFIPPYNVPPWQNPSTALFPLSSSS